MSRDPVETINRVIEVLATVEVPCDGLRRIAESSAYWAPEVRNRRLWAEGSAWLSAHMPPLSDDPPPWAYTVRDIWQGRA